MKHLLRGKHDRRATSVRYAGVALVAAASFPVGIPVDPCIRDMPLIQFTQYIQDVVLNAPPLRAIGGIFSPDPVVEIEGAT